MSASPLPAPAVGGTSDAVLKAAFILSISAEAEAANANEAAKATAESTNALLYMRISLLGDCYDENRTDQILFPQMPSI